MGSEIQDVQGSKRALPHGKRAHSPLASTRIRQSLQDESSHWQGGRDGERKQWSRIVQLHLCQTTATKQGSLWFMAKKCHFNLKNSYWDSQGDGGWGESVAMWLRLRRSGCRRYGFSLQLCPQASSTIWGKLLSVSSVSQPKNRNNWPRKIVLTTMGSKETA